MKKMRIASIMLGVLLLIGAMSGLSMAQTSEEPTQNIQTITFEEFLKSPESFVGKEVELISGAVLSIRKTGLKDSPHDAYLTVTRPAIALREMPWREITKGPRPHFTIIHLPSSLLATKEGKEVEGWKIVTVKGVVKVITKKEWERFEKKTLSGTLTTLDEVIKIQVYNEFIRARSCRAKKIEKVYWIEASEIKVTGQLPFVLHEQKEVLQKKTVAIPDYENFPFKDQGVIDKDGDGKPDLVSRLYIREQRAEELKEQQKLILTAKDLISIGGRLSVGEELLAWIPELSMTIDMATGAFKIKRNTIHYAIKEGSQWKFVDRETYQAKNDEIRKSVGYTDEEIKELREKEKQDQLWY